VAVDATTGREVWKTQLCTPVSNVQAVRNVSAVMSARGLKRVLA
jgi:hypothetical protein